MYSPTMSKASSLLSQQFSNARALQLVVGCAHSLARCTRVLPNLHMERSCPCCHSHCASMCVSALFWLETTGPLVLWTTSGSYSLSTSSLVQIADHWEEESAVYISVGLSSPVSYFSQINQLESLLELPIFISDCF